ncbi:glycerophosphodiester phosphodiesterase family protein [Winogradskyella litorisediminis]|uniref:Glycerophosphodiester phosphodiesterase family protein n=1 Tax=Winogradskyella litorisediminis TaxID=1156618 RepID=A0ABW3N7N2_9FLAO
MKNQHLPRILKLKFSVIILAFMMSCSLKSQIDIQGHRGCRGLFPENSLPAFEYAIKLGVHTLELDIAITKDKQVIVTHEPFMSRTICLNPEGNPIAKNNDKQFNLYEMTHDDIKRFDCGTKLHSRFPKQAKVKVYKPLLKEVFDLVKQHQSDVRLNIEIKSKPEYYGIYTPQPSEYVKLVLNEIKSEGFGSRVNLQSFDLTILEEIKKQSPEMQVAILVDEDESISKKLDQLSYKPEIISPYFKLLSKALVSEYKNQNFKIIPWTVNKEKDMHKMLDFNVDGIITDYPNRLIEILKNM